jgi:hypothetical protein
MIGDDDLASFFDPEEFGCRVVIIGGGGVPADVLGMWGDPAAFGRIQRPDVAKGAAQLRVRADVKVLQVPNEDVPADWSVAKVVDAGVEFAITEVAPHGRLRSLLTLVPYGDRADRAKDTKSNGWIPNRPRAG